MNVFFKKIIAWIYFQYLRIFDTTYTIEHVEDPVERPKNKYLYVIGTELEPWQVEFLCPCGCSDKIVLPVNNETSPRWNIEIKEGIPTLSPSVFRSKGCRSHFFMRRGRVEWCLN
jgi:Family of unknown function (DUF6527)